MTYPNLNNSEDNLLNSSLPPVPISTERSSTERPTRQPQPQKKGIGWLSGPQGLLIGLGIGLGLALLGNRLMSQSSPPAAPAESEQVASASVTVARSETAPIRQTITTNGTVEAFDLLSVSPRASGLQIQSVRVREGDRVSAGQVLAILDSSVLEAQLEQARSQVTAARAQVAQAEAERAQSAASLAEARESLDRYASLYSRGAISQEELTSRRTQVATAEQTVGAGAAAIQSAQATVRSRQAEVDQLQTQLAQTEVLAPESGIIAEKTATVGDIASAGTPLFKIISGDQLELAVKIPQTQIAQVNLGAPVQITSDSDPSLRLEGSVRSIDPTVDPQTRQATAKIGLPGSDRLRPGMFLQAAIVTGSRQGVVVPAEALLPQPDGGFVVYTVSAEGKAVARTVEVGDRISASGDTPAKTEITSGLQPNVAVVVEGASYIQDGDIVEVVK
ncbi:efflux RND transporter periplasmic adaptor subunit [Leptolyngbya sp. BC1307]|uniref:efflux RND transporter periplasmic adaptor subunit n=1 Tax=Leptolyngbya sp. BC1307 TaxID=2029589 RepID=UPI001F0B6472|nr:efflux RND transporter periplasmic adaptor subunit [Leptolyngbya sp. BC1307]